MHLRHLIVSALLLPLAASATAAETVPVSKFNSIELNGGGRVVIRHGTTQRVTLISGSSAQTRISNTGRRGEKLVIDACDGSCPRGYQLRVEIVTPDIAAVAIHGGGTIVAETGFAQQDTIAAAVDGGGEIDLRSLSARDVAAAVHGGGSLVVNARQTLAVAIYGGGEVVYAGDPTLSTAINGGGTVRRLR